ncbi:hypothetical protein QFZ45_001667 [Pseudomonas synxantha]|nr:hypothetical protein [Pseudomonas synxantha]
MTAPNPSVLTTLGVTPFSFHSDQPLFRVNSGVSLHEALRHVPTCSISPSCSRKTRR